MNIFNEISGVFHYEFLMGIRRKGIWLAYSITFLFYYFALFTSGRFLETNQMDMRSLWELNAVIAFIFNLFLPVIAGVSAADRMIRDRQLHMTELLQSSGLTDKIYLLGKYMGALCAMALPVLCGIVVIRVVSLFQGAPAVSFGMTITTFLLVNLPAYAFITAFSLICPLILPTRVYQALFTGYWFWGNFVYPDMFPSLSGTVFQVSGITPAEGVFGSIIDMGNIRQFSQIDVWFNYGWIIACILLVLFCGQLLISRQNKFK